MKSALAFALTLLFAAAKPPAPPPAPADAERPPADATALGVPGLISKTMKAGTSQEFALEDNYVRIRYAIWKSPGGQLIDYIAPGQSAVVPLRKLSAGLHTALLVMHPGETRRIWIPETLARGQVPAGGHLVVDLDLIEIIRTPAVPHDVSMPPADAIKTKSGLVYKVLTEGKGTKHPKRSSTVRVDYTGWTSIDGKMFDSSIVNGEPAEFSLDEVVAGWREALQLMTEGEKARFWIPGELAYGHEQGKPQGMLTFDIELLKIVK